MFHLSGRTKLPGSEGVDLFIFEGIEFGHSTAGRMRRSMEVSKDTIARISGIVRKVIALMTFEYALLRLQSKRTGTSYQPCCQQ